MEHNEPSDHVIYMTEAKYQLHHIPKTDRPIEYQNILTIIEEYLRTHCNHQVIEDDIDIDPEKSMKIKYCNHCGLTL
tara:strand:+ start:2867 stop:3097 length:231 start_codon:yes stop_codon:yes gene_type:complete